MKDTPGTEVWGDLQENLEAIDELAKRKGLPDGGDAAMLYLLAEIIGELRAVSRKLDR